MPAVSAPTGKALRVFYDVIALNGAAFSPQDCSERLGIPTPNLYRHLEALLKNGYLVRFRRGQYLPHPQLLLALEAYSVSGVLKEIVQPLLKTAARNIPATLHFGVFEAEMVTYLVKVEEKNNALFTLENMQLEAYCSAIGKVLLAATPPDQLTAYLAGVDFPKLTEHTLTSPKDIRCEIVRTRRRGYGIDNREIREDLICLAVPVKAPNGGVVGAVSAASTSLDLLGAMRKKVLAELNDAARQIGNRL